MCLPSYCKQCKRTLYFIAFNIIMVIISDKYQARASNGTLYSPTIMVAILTRNKEHTLPHFLGYLEKLDYPKDRISLWIRNDHNTDDTSYILQMWLEKEKHKYHSLNLKIDESSEFFPDEKGVFDWSPMHFAHVIQLREEALETARKMWADFILFLDCDSFLTNNNTLNLLIEQEKTVIAPLLESVGAYSNYWCGMTEQGYYKRTEDYIPILEREKVGCFEVPMVHSAVLINLQLVESSYLTFDPSKLKDYKGPKDDIIAFAYSAKSSGVKMHVLNTKSYGYIMAPLEKGHTLKDDKDQLTNLKVEVMVEDFPLYVSSHLQHFVVKKQQDTLGFDEIYLINLERRPEKRERMLRSLEELGVKAKLINAVDGKQLNDSHLKNIGVKMLPEYSDPYHKRPLTMGEVGCFLSHYNIWNDMLTHQHRTALVFEDDIRFEPYFRRKLQALLQEVQKINLEWDLIYLGRKRLSEDGEPYVAGTTNLVHVDYSYWTLCYMVTLGGARKLVDADPLAKLVPVDEYIPIMFDRHPEAGWKGYFPERNLRAFSAHPLLVTPTYYTGEDNYISDTEDSSVIAVSRDEL